MSLLQHKRSRWIAAVLGVALAMAVAYVSSEWDVPWANPGMANESESDPSPLAPSDSIPDPGLTQDEPKSELVHRVVHRVPDPRPPAQPSPQPSESALKALAWLENQRSEPWLVDGELARLIDSYEDEARAGWIYDTALAAILYLRMDRFESAAEMLRGLESLQNADGSWRFSYDSSRARSFGNAPLYVGAMAWVLVAANGYEAATGNDRFAESVHRCLVYILRFRDANLSSKSFGAVSMGPPNPKVFSVENNLALYAALRGRAQLEDDAKLTAMAESIRRFIFDVAWQGDLTSAEPRHNFFAVGFRDNSLYLDVQTWTTLAFWEEGRGQRAKLILAMETALKRLRSTGHLGAIEGINGFNESADSTISVKVWAEGSEGMVAALRLLGRQGEAVYYHDQTRRYQTASGGIPYATKNSDSWPTEASVAATVWYLFNELDIPSPLSIKY